MIIIKKKSRIGDRDLQKSSSTSFEMSTSQDKSKIDGKRERKRKNKIDVIFFVFFKVAKIFKKVVSR